MSTTAQSMDRNVALYPWFRFLQSLLFWQATWFLYVQQELSASEAILLYAIFDISVTVLEVPSGYMSDRIGRRVTLIASSVATALGLVLMASGNSFAIFFAGQVLLGAGSAFNSGTDSALLYQSLVTAGRENEMETQSIKAWRAAFVALAVSAVLGGLFALWSLRLPFAASAVAMIAVIWLSLQFREPPNAHDKVTSEKMRLYQFWTSLRQPALAWLFALGVVMYGYSHIPFVFGQPFIAQALSAIDAAADAPWVSGIVTALMMGLSVLVSLVAPGLRARMGIVALLLLAFAIQIGLAAALALSGSVLAIAFLMLRMVPDSLSTPFIQAHLQPMLGDDTRATFLSVKSLAGRLLFAASLWLAAINTDAVGVIPLGDIQAILGWYAVAGFGLLTLLALLATRAKFNKS